MECPFFFDGKTLYLLIVDTELERSGDQVACYNITRREMTLKKHTRETHSPSRAPHPFPGPSRFLSIPALNENSLRSLLERTALSR
jgi:hypothetical protein